MKIVKVRSKRRVYKVGPPSQQLPRQGVLIDESLDHLVTQQPVNSIFYLVEIVPNEITSVQSIPRYEVEELEDLNSRSDSPSQLRSSNPSILIEEIPDYEDIDIAL